jgi:hypothetical protein
MLFTGKSLLLSGGNNYTIPDKASSTIVVKA